VNGFDVSEGTLRAIVQIRFWRDNVVTGISTGTIVGRHTILAAAHSFLIEGDPPYNRVTIGIAPPGGGELLEITPIFFAMNTNFEHRFDSEVELINGYDIRRDGDAALIVTREDLQQRPYLVDPFHIEPDYLTPQDNPSEDCDHCPLDVLIGAGWGRRGASADEVLTDRTPTQVTVTVGSNAPNVAQTSVMTFRPYSNEGDSGGPVFYHTFSNDRYNLVGVLSGTINVNDIGEPTPGGARRYDAATTITQAMLNDFDTQVQAWRNASPVAQGASYPTPSPSLPDAQPNPSFTSYPETDPPGSTTQPGFFYSFPFPTPTHAPVGNLMGGNQCG